MRKRIRKKHIKCFMDCFTRNKIPGAFSDEHERKSWVAAFARREVGQKYRFPEEAEYGHRGQSK